MIFFSVIKGTGELDRQQQNNTSSLDTNKILEGCPYLLLDVRDKDAFDQCHIISGRYLFLLNSPATEDFYHLHRPEFLC